MLPAIFILLAFHSAVWSEPIVAAYYENYSQFRPAIGNRKPFTIQAIDIDLLTDLYYAFAIFGYVNKSVNPDHPHLTGNFTIEPTEGNDQSELYPQFLKLKQKAKKPLRTFLCIGGWNFNDPNHEEGKLTYRLFSQMVANAKTRQQFISSAIDYTHRFGFDGIDIDWEYPGDLSRGGDHADFENFKQFLKECSTAFAEAKPKLYLSCSMPAHIPAAIQKDPSDFFSWIAQCASYLDHINIMAYDYHTPFGFPKITGANAPLLRDTNPSSAYFIAKTLENYLNNGVPAEKIVLGMPSFGHSYADVTGMSQESAGPGLPFENPGKPGPATQHSGLLAYYEIADKITGRQLFLGIDQKTSTAYGYNLASKEWVSFDTQETIKLKAQLAADKHLKGGILWAIDMDEYEWEPKFPNLRSIWNVLH